MRSSSIYQFVNDYVEQTLYGAGKGVFFNHLQQLLISSRIDKLLPLAKSGSAQGHIFGGAPFPTQLREAIG